MMIFACVLGLFVRGELTSCSNFECCRMASDYMDGDLFNVEACLNGCEVATLPCLGDCSVGRRFMEGIDVNLPTKSLSCKSSGPGMVGLFVDYKRRKQ